MDQTPFQRLEMFWLFKHIKNASAFAETVGAGVSAGALSAIKRRGSRPGNDIMRAILNKFPDLNADWVLWGQGEMLVGGRSLAFVPAPDPTDPRPSAAARPRLTVPHSVAQMGAEERAAWWQARYEQLEQEMARSANREERLQTLLAGKPKASADAAAPAASFESSVQAQQLGREAVHGFTRYDLATGQRMAA